MRLRLKSRPVKLGSPSFVPLSYVDRHIALNSAGPIWLLWAHTGIRTSEVPSCGRVLPSGAGAVRPTPSTVNHVSIDRAGAELWTENRGHATQDLGNDGTPRVPPRCASHGNLGIAHCDTFYLHGGKKGSRCVEHSWAQRWRKLCCLSRKG